MDESKLYAYIMVKSLRETVQMLVASVCWWEEEHGCCKGASDEELKEASEMIEKADEFLEKFK